MSKLKTLVFSHKRPLQLDATLKSLLLHSPGIFPVVYDMDCSKLANGSFKKDVLEIIDGSEYVLFLVDDMIFTRDFVVGFATHKLKKHPDVIGFSLCLGENTDHCYMKKHPQKVPVMTDGCFDWTKAEYDFAYPLALTGGIYRTKDIMKIINRCHFNTPNTLEAMMHRQRFSLNKPLLGCFETSVAFSAPFNKVQTDYPNNRSMGYPVQELRDIYDTGSRIDIGAYLRIQTNAVHQEVDLYLKGG